MPINKIAPTKRGKALVIAGMLAAAATGWQSWVQSHPVTPQSIHQAIDKGVTPPAVEIAILLAEKWEGLRTVAYLDPIGKPTVCIGETLVDGKPVKLGMRFTVDECRAMLRRRMIHDFYLPLVDNVKDFVKAPDSVQGAALDVAYNIGQMGLRKSSAAVWIAKHDYSKTCQALTLYNKASGRVLPGLDARRKMGDKTREGEAEVCLNTEVSL